jgi:hypothetical protein
MRCDTSGIRVLGGLPCFALVVVTGCGEVSSPGTTGNGGTMSAGADGAGAAGRAGAGGTGGSALSDAGYEDASASGSSGAAGSAGTGSTVPPGCPIPAPEPVPGQLIAIQSIKFSDEDDPASDPAEIVLRNVSDSNVTLVGGSDREGWQWCNVPAYWAITEGPDVTLAPGATYAFVPYYNLGGPRPLFRGDDAQDTNEMGIYPTTGTFEEADKIMAFVIWGEGSTGTSRESIGVMGGFWTFGESIAIGPNDAGFVATGSTKRASGYTGVPRRCLVAPPNPDAAP